MYRLSCFAPHLGEELFAVLSGKEESIAYRPWPVYDESKLVKSASTIAVQVNGKMRGKFEASTDATKEELEKMALNLDSVKAQTEGKTIAKVIVVPGKIVNIVAK